MLALVWPFGCVSQGERMPTREQREATPDATATQSPLNALEACQLPHQFAARVTASDDAGGAVRCSGHCGPRLSGTVVVDMRLTQAGCGVRAMLIIRGNSSHSKKTDTA